MHRSDYEITEVAIVLAAQSHNPTILNPDFLKFNDIVPKSWQLKEPPICAFPLAQVSYTGGVRISSQPDKIVFLETLANPNETNISVAGIACKYAKQVPHVPYTAVGINMRGHIRYDNEEQTKAFILDHFIKPITWSKHENSLTDTKANLTFQVKETIFTVSISQSKFKGTIPAVLFTGNFHHDLDRLNKEERITALCGIVKNWQKDLKIFGSFIEELAK